MLGKVALAASAAAALALGVKLLGKLLGNKYDGLKDVISYSSKLIAGGPPPLQRARATAGSVAFRAEPAWLPLPRCGMV